MWHDPIVDEIHKIREEHAQKFNFDLKSIYGDLKKREKKAVFKQFPFQSSGFRLKKPTLST